MEASFIQKLRRNDMIRQLLHSGNKNWMSGSGQSMNLFSMRFTGDGFC